VIAIEALWSGDASGALALLSFETDSYRVCDDRRMGQDDGEAWAELQRLIADSPRHVVVRMPVESNTTADALGLSDCSFLGALARHSSGVPIDHGWLRILGGRSSDGLPGIEEATGAAAGFLVVAYDVLGGVFALDGGAFGTGDGGVHYFAPDELRWGPLDIGHAQFISAMLSDAAADFYEPFRWPGWQDEVGALGVDEGLSTYPFLWTAEGKDVGSLSRRPVPFRELIDSNNAYLESMTDDSGPKIPLPRRPR
jgi:hypothetical protein